jgi:hypothetical protein
MRFEEAAVEMIGYRGRQTIGVARRRHGRGQWTIRLHGGCEIRAYSRVEVRSLLAVHGADRVTLDFVVRIDRAPGTIGGYPQAAPAEPTALQTIPLPAGWDWPASYSRPAGSFWRHI